MTIVYFAGAHGLGRAVCSTGARRKLVCRFRRRRSCTRPAHPRSCAHCARAWLPTSRCRHKALSLIGTGLWVGWFGFNAGSALDRANATSLRGTHFSSAMAGLSWAPRDPRGKPRCPVPPGMVAGRRRSRRLRVRLSGSRCADRSDRASPLPRRPNKAKFGYDDSLDVRRAPCRQQVGIVVRLSRAPRY